MTETILSAIARRLGKPSLSDNRQTLQTRFDALLTTASEDVRPARDKDNQQWFKDQAIANLFDVITIADFHHIPAALQPTTLPIVLSPQSRIHVPQWREAGYTLSNDFHQPALGVVEAVAGIAETGTVVVTSQDVPSSMLFLCEELAIVLSTTDIHGYQEDIWPQIKHGRYRAVHLISGPSRTADVEQTLQVGAHGPKRVYLMLVNRD
jgi:L-lactate dehydrogenase complex protein LldG